MGRKRLSASAHIYLWTTCAEPATLSSKSFWGSVMRILCIFALWSRHNEKESGRRRCHAEVHLVSPYWFPPYIFPLIRFVLSCEHWRESKSLAATKPTKNITPAKGHDAPLTSCKCAGYKQDLFLFPRLPHWAATQGHRCWGAILLKMRLVFVKCDKSRRWMGRACAFKSHSSNLLATCYFISKHGFLDVFCKGDLRNYILLLTLLWCIYDIQLITL